jgi:hypothetical protein
MDVSEKRSAAEFCANVIARIDDQRIDDQRIDDQRIDDQRIDDQRIDDQRNTPLNA